MAIARTVDRRLFFMLDRAHLQLAQAADQALASGAKLGRAQAAVLIYLGYHDGCTLSELAEGTGRRNAAITGLTDRMESAGLVLREQSHGDRRQRKISLTPEGWAKREDVMSEMFCCHREKRILKQSAQPVMGWTAKAHRFRVFARPMTRRSDATPPSRMARLVSRSVSIKA